MMDSRLLRKTAFRLPALANLAGHRFSTSGWGRNMSVSC